MTTGASTERLLDLLGMNRDDERVQRLASALNGALKANKTSHREGGITVSLDRRDGEHVAFYQTDSDGFRAALELQDARVSDLLVFISASDLGSLIFVEITSGDFSRCIEQLTTAVQCVFDVSKKESWKRLSHRLAVVVSSSSAPRGLAQNSKELQRRYSITLKNESGVRKNSSLSLRNVMQRVPAQ